MQKNKRGKRKRFSRLAEAQMLGLDIKAAYIEHSTKNQRKGSENKGGVTRLLIS